MTAPVEARLQTRAQRDLKLAAELVRQLKAGSESAKIYGGLCHQFPVMVQTVGLAQALAFSAAKGAGDGERARAHQKVLEHVGQVLNLQGRVLDTVQNASAADYMHMTRRVLGAWVYFKRFAVSILKVEASEQVGE